MQNYLAEVNRAYDAYVITKDVTAFVTSLKQINATWIDRFANRGYIAAGGQFSGDIAAATSAEAFINSFADRFGEAMLASPDLDFRWRALMYPAEGHRLAYVLGQQAAMTDRGAKAWQRVLHPEASVSGPCELCIADSQIVHPIDELFILLHPGDVCTVQESIAYYATPPEMVKPGERPEVELPVPERPTVPDIVKMLKDSLRQLGENIKHIVRRIRK